MTSKAELVSALAQKAGLKEVQIENVLEALIETVADSLSSGQQIHVTGFGTFKTASHASDPAGNPRTGRIKRPAARVIQFQTGAALGKAIQAKDAGGPPSPGAPHRRETRSHLAEVKGAPAGDELDLALAEARRRGAARAAEILTGPDMLSGDDFARLIGVTREAVRQKAMRHEALGLRGAKRGVRYPAWQVTGDGGLLPDLPQLFMTLGDSPWAVYRFLIQPNPAFKGSPPLEALRAGRAKSVLEAAEGVARGDFG